MAGSIEDILYAKALAESTAPDPSPYVIGGGTIGGLLGTMVGEIPHQVGRGANTFGAAVVPKYETEMVEGEKTFVLDKAGNKKRIGRGGAMRPGFRAAGGLVGAILGGSLGWGLRDEMIRSSPELQQLMAQQNTQGLT